MLFVTMTSAGYEVQPGETLAEIAADHGTTVAALVEANGITNPDLIVVGQVLTLPGETGEESHTVSAGETLAGIAARYGVTVSDLIDANGLSNPDLLSIGQLVAIPGSQPQASGASQTIVGTHLVAAGDSLASIARRYGTTVEAIAQVNGITNPSRIFIGTQLTIAEGVAGSTTTEPIGTSLHTVGAGETLAAIAVRFGTSVQALITSNGIDDPDLIRAGQELSVPSSGWVCPVANSRYFNDWGFPRSGGRFHQGNDLFAPRGTEVLAPVSGFVELKSGVVGGLQFWMTGDDGRTYIGTHLDGFALAGEVQAGSVIGYVGDSGNAVGSDPHLHFEILVDGSPINPYPILQQSGC
ncbi:MAG: LysM peptidoglycan-binding domain-containing M23 family metallopeptidase [Acidimicrobiia bacterium]|nr:LysM peptidoglycan-binding domain-containing M23 family metallopeptidase [Acidimicrobiia bacterium]